MLEIKYIEKSYNPVDPTKPIETEKTLTIDSHVTKITEDIPNPSGGEDAYYYSLTVNGMTQMTTFKPGEDGYQAMTEEEANLFLNAEIQQTKRNFGILN